MSAGVATTPILMDVIQKPPIDMQLANPDYLPEDLLPSATVKGEDDQPLIRGIDHGESTKNKTYDIIYPVGMIMVSAFIFISFVSWAEVIRSAFDGYLINEEILKHTLVKLYYAIFITLVSIIMIVILFVIWKKYFKKYH